MTFWIKLAIVAGVLAVAFGAGFKTAVNHYRVAALHDQVATLQEAQRSSAALAEQRATTVAELTDANQQSQEDVDALRKDLQARPVADACALSDADRQRLLVIRPRRATR